MMGNNVCLPHRVHIIILVSFMIKTNSVTTSIWTDSLPDPFPPHRLTASTATVWAMSIVDYLIHHQHIVASVLRCRSERRNPKKTRICGSVKEDKEKSFPKEGIIKTFQFLYFTRFCWVMRCQKLLQPAAIYRTSSIESSNHRSQCVDLIWFDWICRCQLTSETKSCVDWRLVVENRGVGLAFRKSNEKFHDICCASETIQQTSIQQLSSNFQKKTSFLDLRGMFLNLS